MDAFDSIDDDPQPAKAKEERKATATVARVDAIADELAFANGMNASNIF